MAPRRRRPPRPGASGDVAPLRILTQIFTLQLCWYMTAIILIVFTTIVAGQHPNPDLFFNWRSLRGDVTTGWTLGLCWMLDSLITVIPILLLIARSKLVADFAITIHVIHLLVTSLYTRAVPTTVYWWLVQLCSAALMTGLGIWACQWRELQPMLFSGNGGKQQQDAQASQVNGAAVEEREGWEMSGGREEGRDGAGAYELVGLENRDGG